MHGYSTVLATYLEIIIWNSRGQQQSRMAYEIYKSWDLYKDLAIDF